MSFLMKAGVSLRESLLMIREQTHKKRYAAILDAVINHVSNGKNLSTSLARFKNIFGNFTISIIGFGEQSGILSENLEYVADELEKRNALRKKIISASIYPIIVTIATLFIVIFLIVYLFPKIMPIFRSINMDLPFSTRIVISVSNFIIHYGLISILFLVVIFTVIFVLLKKNQAFHFYFDAFLLKIPVIGKMIRDYNMANFTRTFGLLLKSGISVAEALPISARTTANIVYKRELKILANIVNRGAKISTHLAKRRKIFPEIVTQIISVGEHSGNLSGSLIYLSEMYESELDDFTKNLGNMVEPILMIIMGVLIGFIAISIITPIYGITQHLQPK